MKSTRYAADKEEAEKGARQRPGTCLTERNKKIGKCWETPKQTNSSSCGKAKDQLDVRNRTLETGRSLNEKRQRGRRTEGPLWPVCRLERNGRTERSRECLLLALGQQNSHYFLIMEDTWSVLSLFVLSVSLSLPSSHPLGLFKSIRKRTTRKTKPTSTLFL